MRLGMISVCQLPSLPLLKCNLFVKIIAKVASKPIDFKLDLLSMIFVPLSWGTQGYIGPFERLHRAL